MDAWKCILRHRLAAKAFMDLYGPAWFGPIEAFCSTSIGQTERKLSTFLEAVGSSLVRLEPNDEHDGAFYFWLRDLSYMEDRLEHIGHSRRQPGRSTTYMATGVQIQVPRTVSTCPGQEIGNYPCTEGVLEQVTVASVVPLVRYIDLGDDVSRRAERRLLAMDWSHDAPSKRKVNSRSSWSFRSIASLTPR